jgi:putative Mn2+ efflux pump MntP
MFFITLLKTFFLSLVLSVDDMAVGVSYGLRKTAIPLKNLLFIVLGSTTSMYVSMLLGKFVISFFNETATKYLSFFLLAGLGCRVMYVAWQDSKKKGAIQQLEHPKWLNPISLWESLYLGISLGIDDFAEAIGLAIAGFPIILTVFLFKLSEVIAIYTGYLLGAKELSRFMTPKLAFIPGIALICIGIWQLL